MLHKILSAVFCSAAVFALTGCGLFQSAYPEQFPANWKEKETYTESKRELAPGLTAYHFHFKDYADGVPLSFHAVVADWKKTGGKLRFAVKAMTDKTGSVASAGTLVSATGTECDAAGKPLTAVKSAGTIFEPANAAKRIKGHMLVSAKEYFPMIVKSSPVALSEKGFENAIQGMLLAKDGKSVFSRPMSGTGAYTAIGLNQEKQLMILLVVDGYHEKESPGVSFSELPQILLALGAKDVLCINAGPVGVLALEAENGNGMEIVSYPSDGGIFDHAGARPAQNLLVFEKAPVTAKVEAKKKTAVK